MKKKVVKKIFKVISSIFVAFVFCVLFKFNDVYAVEGVGRIDVIVDIPSANYGDDIAAYCQEAKNNATVTVASTGGTSIEPWRVYFYVVKNDSERIYNGGTFEQGSKYKLFVSVGVHKNYGILTGNVSVSDNFDLNEVFNEGANCPDAMLYSKAYIELKNRPEPPVPNPAPAHTHEFIEGTITEPTADSDGVGGIYCKTCGYVKETYPISAYAYVLYDYGATKIKSSQPGQNVVFEFGEWNSFPKSFMADLAAKSAAGVTFEFHYKWNQESQTIIIPAGVPIDLNEEWYGPAKMRELYLQYSPIQ